MATRLVTNRDANAAVKSVLKSECEIGTRSGKDVVVCSITTRLRYSSVTNSVCSVRIVETPASCCHT
ncbi:hypothetical protein, partial [Streptomyces edwardsiae]